MLSVSNYKSEELNPSFYINIVSLFYLLLYTVKAELPLPIMCSCLSAIVAFRMKHGNMASDIKFLLYTCAVEKMYCIMVGNVIKNSIIKL